MIAGMIWIPFLFTPYRWYVFLMLCILLIMLFFGYRFRILIDKQNISLSKTFFGIPYFKLTSPLHALFIPHKHPKDAEYKPSNHHIATLTIDCDEEDPWLRDSPECLIIFHHQKPIEFFTTNDRQTFDFLVEVLQKKER